MARRGDVLALRRRIGFGTSSTLERFAVLQSDRFSTVLDSILAAPVERSLPLHAGFPAAVPVSGAEAGTTGDQVLMPAFLTSMPLDRFEPEPVGRLRPATLASASRLLRLLFDLG